MFRFERQQGGLLSTTFESLEQALMLVERIGLSGAPPAEGWQHDA